MKTYDLVVIGSGPAGQKAAIQAAKLGKRVGIVERRSMVGGVCINTGTIPSKSLREAVVSLSGLRQRVLYGTKYSMKKGVSMSDLLFRKDHVVKNEIEIIYNQMERNDVDMLFGSACFTGPHQLVVQSDHGQEECSAEKIIIACGTIPLRPPDVPFDEKRIFDSDTILQLAKIPKTLTIVGGGVIGCEYACMFGVLGVRVTLIDQRKRLLRFVDEQISEALSFYMRNSGMELKLGETIEKVGLSEDGRPTCSLASGKKVTTDCVLYALGRKAATETLDLQAAGVQADRRGGIQVNENYQTNVPHIYAVGDVIGFPCLASTSMEQGRLASCHAFEVPAESFPSLFPYGIYTIPEISMVGKTEETLTEQGVPYEVGQAFYREIARGQIIGDQQGMLKLIFNRENLDLLGVHAIGEGASELIHIGQAVLSYRGKVDYFINNVFNYPTLAECYRVAALNGVNKLG